MFVTLQLSLTYMAVVDMVHPVALKAVQTTVEVELLTAIKTFLQ